MTQPVPKEELEVLAAAVRGETVPRTSRRLALSESTVNRLRKSAVRRLHARCFVHAVALAVAAGLISVEPPAGGEGDG